MLTTFNLKITKHVLITIYYTTTGKQDDVTTGRNLALHLNRGDMVDVGLDKMMSNGAGLTHSSFCMTEISRSRLNAVYSCGYKANLRNKKGVVTYDRYLTNNNGFGSKSLDLARGLFTAPVEGVYLVNFHSHFDTGRGPTTNNNMYRIIIRKNGENIGSHGTIQTSVQGLDDHHDDVTAGRSLTLYLQRDDQLEVVVEEVIPVGAGLTHTTFCVTLIPQSPAIAHCGLAQGPVNSLGVMTYDHIFTNMDQYSYGGLDQQTGAFKAPITGTYLVSFYTQVGGRPISGTPTGYYSAYIRRNGRRLAYEGHIKSSIVGADNHHMLLTTGRSIVLQLQGSDVVDIEINKVMVEGGGFSNTSFCVTLIKGDDEEEEEK